MTLDASAEFESVDEQLVAYLDGELAPEAAATLETQLAQDALLRERLQQLQAAWDMLDELPQQDVPARFAQTTIAMVVQDAAKEAEAEGESALARLTRAWGLTAMACLLACFGGYRLVYGILNAPNQRLKRDLEVIDNIDAYRNAESVEFLRRLADEGLFEDEVQNMTETESPQSREE